LKSEPKTRFRLTKKVGFSCPYCGLWHSERLTQEIPKGKIRLDPYDDFLVGPPGARIMCSCGADLLILGEPDNFDVIWSNRKELIQAKVLKTKPLALASEGLYYDLVRVPHGHVPVGKVWLWRRFPLVVKEFRGDKYFTCPDCGAKSFFKQSPHNCEGCNWRLFDLRHEARKVALHNFQAKGLRLARRDYFRRFLKDLDVLILPVIALMGKAWYVRSERTHYVDKVPYFRTHFWRRFN
jgi:DNA-directed RNA polymerase subunit RPC12/RpoP